MALLQFGDAGQIVLGQRRAFGSGGEFANLRFVVDVRQAAGNAFVSQEPLERSLPERAVRADEELQRLDFLEAVDQPRFRAMTAVIGRRERRVLRILALEHAARVSDADQVARARVRRLMRQSRFARVDDLLAWVRLERIVDMLEHMGPATLYAIDAFVKPADGRAKRRAVGTNLTFDHELLHQLPEGVVLHLRHADIVELQNVDVIGLEPRERLVHRLANERHGEILRNLALAPPFVAVVVKIVADLRRDHDLLALVREGLRDQFLAVAVAVGIGRIKKRDAQVERLVHQTDRLALGECAPPAGGNRPKTETDFRDANIGLRQRAKFHGFTLSHPPAAGKIARQLVETTPGNRAPLIKKRIPPEAL
jgi:hypothetical protein